MGLLGHNPSRGNKFFIICGPYLGGKKIVLIYPYLRDRPIGIKNIPLPRDI
jgi:hypothetical protein